MIAARSDLSADPAATPNRPGTFQPSRNGRHRRAGMSLLEVVISVAILTTVCLSVLAVFLQGRRVAEGNVFENTALTVAQGFIEQIKSMDYLVLLEVWGDPEANPIPTKGVAEDGLGGMDVVDEPLYLNQRNPIGKFEGGEHLGVLIDLVRTESGGTICPDTGMKLEDGDPKVGYTPRYMQMWVTPTINNLEPTQAWRALEVTLHFEWEARDRPGTAGPHSASVRFVKSIVPSF